MTIHFAILARRRLAAAVAAALCCVLPAAAATPSPNTQGMVEAPCTGLPALPDVPRALVDMFIEPGAMRPAELERLIAGPIMTQRARAEEMRRQLDWPDLCRYAAANATVTAAGTAIDGVFLGDSITELWSESAARVFGDHWLNRGIAGQTSPQILLRFAADVAALRPRFVHLMAGTNDIAGNTGPTSAQRYQDNIEAMVAIAKRQGIAVLLASIPPAASMPWRPSPGTPARIEALNRWLKALALSEDLVYVDYHAVLAAPDGTFRADFSNDGVHPNNRGYARMKSVLESALGQLPDKRSQNGRAAIPTVKE
ncbi:GDSL-type esterase/lipase family protein [Janthinobacterium tructae]|nr:GDSL-type esterase/lipase family protein [Janthinobacterium tructae]